MAQDGITLHWKITHYCIESRCGLLELFEMRCGVTITKLVIGDHRQPIPHSRMNHPEIHD